MHKSQIQDRRLVLLATAPRSAIHALSVNGEAYRASFNAQRESQQAPGGNAGLEDRALCKVWEEHQSGNLIPGIRTTSIPYLIFPYQCFVSVVL